MQVETEVGRQHPRKVPRKVGLVLLGVTLLLLVASSPAQASTTHSQSAKGVVTLLAATTCYTFHQKSNLAIFGYVNVGYNEIDVGVCYDSNYRPTLQWGPICSSGWYVPFIRTTATNYCTWWRNSNGSITLYGNWTAQIWYPFIGWCCDRTFTFSYGV
jgi:hypothetical protein